MNDIKEIGRGRDGIIYQISSELVEKRFFSKKEFENELIVKKFLHPNIVRPVKVDPKKKSIYYPFYKKFDTVKWNHREVMKMLFQISDALCEIQKNGYLYTDVSPNNIMIDANGDFVLIDLASLQKLDSVKGVYANDNFLKKISKSVCLEMTTAQPFELTAPALLLYETAMRTKKSPPKLRRWMSGAACPTIFGFRAFLRNCLQESTDIKNFDLKYRLKFFGSDLPLDKKQELVYEKTFLN